MIGISNDETGISEDPDERYAVAKKIVERAERLAGELRRQGRRVPLHDKPFQVLAALLEEPGRVVTREELI